MSIIIPTAIDLTNERRLLSRAKTILKHQKELEITRGEAFNIFSVLGLERHENRTHSAFIAELLNPKGTHYFGDSFLQIFLEKIQHDKKDIKKNSPNDKIHSNAV